MAWAKTLVALLLGRDAGLDPASAPAAAAPPAPLLLDATTRTFWSHGAVAPATLIETGAGPDQDWSAARRVSAIVAAQERRPRPTGRPRANPAFSEAVFVELMRARQYSRAFDLLAADCQRSWGSIDAFAAEHANGLLARLQGVEVLSVRFLPLWEDPERHVTHEDVAELDVEYALAQGAGTAVIPRTVHLIATDGRWRSVCYPRRVGGDR